MTSFITVTFIYRISHPGEMSNYVQLNNGTVIPTIGLGTWQLMSKDAIRTAIDVGYRHFDTAMVYENESLIGEVLAECIKEGKVKREDLYIVTKCPPTQLGKDAVGPAFEKSLRNLQTEYIDLYLVHCATGFKNYGLDKACQFGDFEHYDQVETWKEMEKLVDIGKVRSIGVSNYNSAQLDYVLKNARILPVTNQVEAHPFLPQKELMEMCRQRGITLTAYCPLGSPGFPEAAKNEGEIPVLLENKTLCQLAKKYNKTPAQVSIRYLTQRGFIVVPKSSNAKRQLENFEVFRFTLDDADMEAISSIPIRYRYFAVKYLALHPDFPFNIPY